MFLGALVTVVVVAALRGYVLVSNGRSLSEVPIQILLLDVMELPKFALLGAIGGLTLGVLEWSYRAIRYRKRKHKEAYQEVDTADELIKADREARADEYLRQVAAKKASLPEVENVVTAMDGKFTFCVMAFRELSYEERTAAIQEGLATGKIHEPEPGGVAILVTDIGRDDTQAPNQ